MQIVHLLSPLSDFARIITEYFAEIWEFLVLTARISATMVVLVGAIMWLTEVNPKRGKGLVLSGILLAVVVQYFTIYPPVFVIS
ncbi:MAG: hypothetical protein ACW99U_01365 [Candidatus Thorarchaeota archaeon]